MSNKSKGRSKRHSSNRTPGQVVEYKSFLEDPHTQPEDTVDVCNSSLVGSDNLQYSQQSDVKKDFVPMPFRRRAWKWFQDNGIIAVIIAALITFGGWTVTAIHNNHVAIEKLTVQIEYLEEDIKDISGSSVETDIINAELEAIKTELNSAWSLDIKEIENRLNILELQIDVLH